MTDRLKFEIAFSLVRNMNSGLAKQLLTRLGSEDVFFSMSESELAALCRLPEPVRNAAYRDTLLKMADKELRFIVANEIKTLYFDTPQYPERLNNCNDGPVMLYKLGEANLDARHVVAIVGTRNATPHGLEITRRLVRDISERLEDVVIVSGLAYGIDVAAHKAALEFGLPTVAVTAHPLNTIYPADHRGVAVNILKEGGAILTEYSTSHEVHRANFLARNRIIAGMSDVTIVVESDLKGGSLVTAGLAMEYDREVFAVPGRLTDKYSKGTNNLIASDKARIYTSIEDFMSEMGWAAKSEEGEQLILKLELNEHEQQVFDYLIQNPAKRLNDIMLATGLHAAQLKEILFNLEMKDIVMSMAGGKYSALTN